MRECWSEGGHGHYDIANVYLALHREQHIEIEFGVGEGTSFMTLKAHSFRTAYPSFHVILTRLPITDLPFLI